MSDNEIRLMNKDASTESARHKPDDLHNLANLYANDTKQRNVK